ncbi:MAG: tyrosine-type recombinase/integrase [Planctomycetota bacterium]
MSQTTADQAAAAIDLFEASTGNKNFAAFHVAQVKKFKRDLDKATHEKTGKPLAVATINARLHAVKTFFLWLADQPGYKSRISYSDCEYFNPTANAGRIATARREKPVPALEQVRHVIATSPHETIVQMRDRALIAFTLLTGMRDAATASLPLGLVDLEARKVFQDARVVKTKNAKTMTTWFFPVGDEVEVIIAEWIAYLRTVLMFGDSDPLFPATDVKPNDEGVFEVAGVKREFWQSASAIRRIFKEQFEAAEVPYFHPHSFRKTLATLGERQCRTPEEFKAWSQNLGHEQVLTTFTSYGKVEDLRTAEILLTIESRRAGVANGDPSKETVDQVLEFILNKRGK